MKVAVVGAGISGLTTAFYLQKAGISVKVFEKEKNVGGKAKTIIEDGYLVEYGPNGFLDSKESTLKLVKDAKLSDRLYKSSDLSRKRFLFLKGKLQEIPENPFKFLTSPVLSLKGKLRILAEVFVPPNKSWEDESVSSFVSRRLGKEALEVLIDPMVAGIYAGNPDKLGMKSAFYTIFKLEKEYGGLIRGLVAKLLKGEKKGPAPSGVLTSFVNGVGELTGSLAKELKHVETDAEVIGIEKLGIGWKVVFKKSGREREETFDAIVLSTPSYVSAKLLKPVASEISNLLAKIPYSPIVVVAFGFEKSKLNHDLNGFGFVVPRTEKRKILGVLWDSSIFPNRAPKGKALIRVMLGGARNPELIELSEEELVKIALEELALTMGINSEPEKVWVFKHFKGIPHYDVGHYDLVKEIFATLKNYKGLFLCNNSLTGIGINDCTQAGINTARKVLALHESSNN